MFVKTVKVRFQMSTKNFLKRRKRKEFSEVENRAEKKWKFVGFVGFVRGATSVMKERINRERRGAGRWSLRRPGVQRKHQKTCEVMVGNLIASGGKGRSFLLATIVYLDRRWMGKRMQLEVENNGFWGTKRESQWWRLIRKTRPLGWKSNYLEDQFVYMTTGRISWGCQRKWKIYRKKGKLEGNWYSIRE